MTERPLDTEREPGLVPVEARNGHELRPADPNVGERCRRYSSSRCPCWACEDDRFGGPDE